MFQRHTYNDHGQKTYIPPKDIEKEKTRITVQLLLQHRSDPKILEVINKVAREKPLFAEVLVEELAHEVIRAKLMRISIKEADVLLGDKGDRYGSLHTYERENIIRKEMKTGLAPGREKNQSFGIGRQDSTGTAGSAAERAELSDLVLDVDQTTHAGIRTVAPKKPLISLLGAAHENKEEPFELPITKLKNQLLSFKSDPIIGESIYDAIKIVDKVKGKMDDVIRLIFEDERLFKKYIFNKFPAFNFQYFMLNFPDHQEKLWQRLADDKDYREALFKDKSFVIHANKCADSVKKRLVEILMKDLELFFNSKNVKKVCDIFPDAQQPLLEKLKNSSDRYTREAAQIVWDEKYGLRAPVTCTTATAMVRLCESKASAVKALEAPASVPLLLAPVDADQDPDLAEIYAGQKLLLPPVSEDQVVVDSATPAESNPLMEALDQLDENAFATDGNESDSELSDQELADKIPQIDTKDLDGDDQEWVDVTSLSPRSP